MRLFVLPLLFRGERKTRLTETSAQTARADKTDMQNKLYFMDFLLSLLAVTAIPQKNGMPFPTD